MIDIFEIEAEDIVFKNYQGLKIKNLVKPQGTYKYWRNIGFNVFFWVNQNLIFNTSTFSKYLSEYLQSFGLKINSLNATITGSGITSLNISIDANNISGV